MWDWYNRPGGINSVPTWKVAVAMVVAGVLCTVILWLLYALLAPFLFTRVR